MLLTIYVHKINKDEEQGFVSKRKKMESQFCSKQRDGSESDAELLTQNSTAASPLLSPNIGLLNDKTSTTTYGQHNQTLASWEKIALLGEKSTKGPMLFAHEHLQTRLQVQEGKIYLLSRQNMMCRHTHSLCSFYLIILGSFLNACTTFLPK